MHTEDTRARLTRVVCGTTSRRISDPPAKFTDGLICTWRRAKRPSCCAPTSSWSSRPRQRSISMRCVAKRVRHTRSLSSCSRRKRSFITNTACRNCSTCSKVLPPRHRDGDAGDDVTRHEHIPLKPTSEIKRVIFCTGKIYYQLARQRLTKKIDDVTRTPRKQLFPFPHDALARRIQRYPNAHFVWAQEDPKYGLLGLRRPSHRHHHVHQSAQRSANTFIGRPPSAAPRDSVRSPFITPKTLESSPKP